MGTCYDSWTVSIKFKLGNYHQELRAAGCSEVKVNEKRLEDSRHHLKKARGREVNFLPDIPARQSEASLQNESDTLQ